MPLTGSHTDRAGDYNRLCYRPCIRYVSADLPRPGHIVSSRKGHFPFIWANVSVTLRLTRHEG